MDEELTQQVSCYSGVHYAERPLAFTFRGRRHTVAAVVRQWRLPEGPCFRTITQEEETFDLVYIEAGDTWRVFPLSWRR